MVDCPTSMFTSARDAARRDTKSSGAGLRRVPHHPRQRRLTLENGTREMPQGHPQNKREADPCKKERREVLGMGYSDEKGEWGISIMIMI